MSFRIGIVSWLVVLVCDVLAAWGLYLYFRPANRDVSLLAAWMRLVYAAILGAAMLNLSHVLVLITGDSHAAALGDPQFQTQVGVAMETFDAVWSVGLVVFGIHILLLGYLVISSGYTPRILGWILILAFVGYIIINLGQVLVPSYALYETPIGVVFLVPMVIGEVGFGLWLFIWGLRAQPSLDVVNGPP